MLPIVIIVFLQQIKRTFFKLKFQPFVERHCWQLATPVPIILLKTESFRETLLFWKSLSFVCSRVNQKEVENSFAQTPVCKNKCFVELLSSFKTNCKSKTSPPLLRSPIPRRQTQSYATAKAFFLHAWTMAREPITKIYVCSRGLNSKWLFSTHILRQVASQPV